MAICSADRSRTQVEVLKQYLDKFPKRERQSVATKKKLNKSQRSINQQLAIASENVVYMER